MRSGEDEDEDAPMEGNERHCRRRRERGSEVLRDGASLGHKGLGEAVEEMKCKEFAIVVANSELGNTLSREGERDGV